MACYMKAVGVTLVELVKGNNPSYRERKRSEPKPKPQLMIPLPERLMMKQRMLFEFEDEFRKKALGLPSDAPAPTVDTDDSEISRAHLTDEEKKQYLENIEKLALTERELAEAVLQDAQIAPRLAHITNTDAIKVYKEMGILAYDLLKQTANISVFDHSFGRRSSTNKERAAEAHLIVRYPKNCAENIIRPSPAIAIRSNTPVVFIDVDGAVNVFGESNVDRALTAKVVCRDIEPLDITYHQHTVDAINRWVGQVEVRWLTYWWDDARFNLAPALGIKDFPVSPIGKMEMNEEILTKHKYWERPIVWIDDEISGELRYSVKELQEKKKDVLIVDTLNEKKGEKRKAGDYIGLTPQAIARVDEFISRYV